MASEKMTEDLLCQLESHGFAARMISAVHIDELEAEISARQHGGQFDGGFFHSRLSKFDFKPPPDTPGLKSVIIVAVPQPQIRITFLWKNTARPAIIPPTYLHDPGDLAKNILEKILEPQGKHLFKAGLPLKLLAARSGLGSYGKNNILYVDNLGSFHRLAAFYSDMPAFRDSWQESRMMEDCLNCWACLRICPTGAITEERFLLRAERCLTYLNEEPGEFPSWLNPSWHNCLVGCMFCQKACPRNKHFLRWIEDRGEFEEEATQLLIAGVQFKYLPLMAQKKLEELDLLEYLEVLPRNMKAFLGEKDDGQIR